MPSRRTGHIVQISRPVFEGGRADIPLYVDVAGRMVARTASQPGWQGVSRELPLRRAKRFAKAYARAGFPTRVILRTNDGSRAVVLELKPSRKGAR